MTSQRILAAAWLLFSLAAGSGALAADPSKFIEDKPGSWQFSLLPRPFQKDPKIDLSIITEVTLEGKKLTPPTAARPVYYLPSVTGYHDEGQGVASQHTLGIEMLRSHLELSLTQSHYLATDAAHPASQIIFFVWGSANTYDEGGDGNAATDIGHHNLLGRAALVGGIKFAQDYGKALAAVDLARDTGMKSNGPSPMTKFLDRDNGKTLQLVEQSKADCYYVVASAYAAAGFSTGARKLLWRTKMSANSQGVSIDDTLPTLITAAATYFGKDMSEPATLRGNLIPAGSVEVGTPVVVPPPAAH